MAKQRGIHQISGKINNLCYYEQKYVRGGLIRRINEAMSERLKSDPVFANTREANKIFGGCSLTASALLDFFGSRNSFMFKPYRQALLTKSILSYFVDRSTNSIRPLILSRSSGFNFLPNIFDSIIKNKIRNSFPELPERVSNLELDGQYEFVIRYESLVNFCNKYKCIGVRFSVSNYKYLYSTIFNDEVGGYVVGDSNPGGRVFYQDFMKDDPAEDMSFVSEVGNIDDATTFWIVYANPIIRLENNRPVFKETGASCGIITYLAI